jgi:hypothetical protein
MSKVQLLSFVRPKPGLRILISIVFWKADSGSVLRVK